jgi:hypothetical protein
MKSLDPNSTVREGEYANAQNAGGVDAKIRNFYNSATKGTILTPEQRADFLSIMERQGEAARSQMEPIRHQYSVLANRAGIDSLNVALDPFAGMNARNETPAARNPFAHSPRVPLAERVAKLKAQNPTMSADSAKSLLRREGYSIP